MNYQLCSKTQPFTRNTEHEEWHDRGRYEISLNNSLRIRWIQDSLNKILGLRLKVDGIIGPQTRSAIRSFQQNQGLIVDGIVGPKSEAAINAALRRSPTPLKTEPPYTTPALLTPPAADQTIQRTVYGWSQYKRRVEDLPTDQQAVLKEVGDAIIASHKSGGQPVRTVKVDGHADWDTPRNPQREQQMSEERARMVTDWLKNYVGSAIAAQITWDTQGFGATKLKSQPTTEANRRQNRRVEIVLSKQGISQSRCIQFPTSNSHEFNIWLQRSLNQILGIRLPMNGIIRGITQQALRNFQQRKNLVPSGTVDRATQVALYKAGAPSAPYTVNDTPKANENTGFWFRQIFRDPTVPKLTTGGIAQALTRAVGLPSSLTPPISISKLEPFGLMEAPVFHSSHFKELVTWLEWYEQQLENPLFLQELRKCCIPQIHPEPCKDADCFFDLEVRNIKERVRQLRLFYQQEMVRNVNAEDGSPVNWRTRWIIVSIAIAEIGRVIADLREYQTTDQSSTCKPSTYSNLCKQICFGGMRLKNYIDTACPQNLGKPSNQRNCPPSQNQWWREICIECGEPSGCKGYTLRKNWCGLFATWALKRAGLNNLNWIISRGISDFFSGGVTCHNPLPGDILYIDCPYNHHGIVVGVRGKNIISIEGNIDADIEYRCPNSATVIKKRVGSTIAVKTKELAPQSRLWVRNKENKCIKCDQENRCGNHCRDSIDGFLHLDRLKPEIAKINNNTMGARR